MTALVKQRDPVASVRYHRTRTYNLLCGTYLYSSNPRDLFPWVGLAESTGDLLIIRIGMRLSDCLETTVNGDCPKLYMELYAQRATMLCDRWN